MDAKIKEFIEKEGYSKMRPLRTSNSKTCDVCGKSIKTDMNRHQKTKRCLAKK